MEKIKIFNRVPIIGEVYLMKFTQHGAGRNCWRPGVVLQNNIGNANSPNIIAVPLTSVIKKVNQPTHVVVYAADTELLRDSMALCEKPETIEKESIGKYVTTLSSTYMKEIAIASSIATAAIAYLSVGELINVRREAIRLNQKITSNW